MEAVKSKGPKLGMRHLQTLLLFFDIVVAYMARLNVGVAVVAMTNAETSNPDFPEFDWDEKKISYILSSFFWGYVATQFVGGSLCKHFGTKLVMCVSTFGSGLGSALTPLCVMKGGWQAFCAIRVATGLFQGMMFPCIHQHLAKWSPPQERNRLGTLSHTGIECGTVLALGVSGIIAESPLGWPGISYISGGMCFTWCILWWILGANNANESKLISKAERDYIESSLVRAEDFHQKKIPVPWRAIFTSKPFLALCVTRCCAVWGLSTMQHQIPSYMNGVLNMEIKSNALFSALPFLAMWILSYVYALAAEIIQHKQCISLTSLRKCINTMAFWLPAIGLVGIGFLDDDQKTLAITLMTLLVGLNSGTIIGCTLNTIDLSPNHAGILMGIANTTVSFMPIITPLVVGVIVTDTHSRTQWQLVFLIAASVFFVGNVIYLIWGTAKTQPWDAQDFLSTKIKLSSASNDKTNTTSLESSDHVKNS